MKILKLMEFKVVTGLAKSVNYGGTRDKSVTFLLPKKNLRILLNPLPPLYTLIYHVYLVTIVSPNLYYLDTGSDV